MSFSSAWLTLREPADALAREPELLRALERHFKDHDYADVVDLGCGTGANLRATFSALPKRQNWLLIDNDRSLMAVAGERLSAWADGAGVHGDALVLEKDGHSILVRFQETDIARDHAPWSGFTPDLVTASALFDLVSDTWIDRFVEGLAEVGIPLYASLIYDGRARWQPAHPADAQMVTAFNRHQQRDKGFGTAAGFAATDALSGRLTELGYEVGTAESPWMLGPESAELAAQLNRGWADAVREMGTVPSDTVDEWLAIRLIGEQTLVGHNDLLALPRKA
jgi:SAM-dependent methyltransferase